MKQLILLLAIVLQSNLVFAQPEIKKKTEEWIDKKAIELNKPTTPEGFERQTDCKERPIYRKESSDTIILFTWGGSIAEDLKTFQESIKDKGFNVYRYPSKIQNNGTVIVNRMSKSTFIWRNDTLYLLDDYNKAAADAHMKIMEEFFSKKISKEEYQKALKEFDVNKFPNTPRFKVIYFKEVFNENNQYQFSYEENFRKEHVSLVDNWIENGSTYLEINLDTHTNGRYRFSSDMKFLERNNCRNQ